MVVGHRRQVRPAIGHHPCGRGVGDEQQRFGAALAEHVLDQRAVVGGVADETRQRPAVQIRLPIRIGRDAELDEERRPRSKIGGATSELQSLMRISYAVFCLKKQIKSPYHATALSSVYFYATHVHEYTHFETQYT